MRVPPFLAIPFAFVLLAASLSAAEERGEAPTPFCRIFDTGRTDTLVPANDLAHQFVGDVRLENDKLSVMLDRQAGYMIVCPKIPDGPQVRMSMGTYALLQGRLRDPIVSFRLLENDPGAAMVQLARKIDPKVAISFRITTGEPIVEVRPAEGVDKVLVDPDASYAIIPEFFADDMVFDIPVPGSKVNLPVESLCLYPVNGGDAIEMCVFKAVPSRAAVAGEGPTWFHLASGKSMWLAFLEGKGIWHKRAAGAKDDWQPPFPAKWRCSVAGKDGLAVSYDYEKGPPAGVTLPDGPAIIYPIDRTKATPLTTILPIDVMRNTLGVGPCQYVLQAEGLASETNPTPEQVSHWVEQQFKRKKEKAAAAEIKDRLAQMVDHVARVQARIGQYGDSAKPLRQVCQKHAGDESAARCLAIVDHLERAATTKDDAPKAAKQLADAVAALIGKENALEECQGLGEQIRAIGSAQDGALARCRLHVRRIRAECASRPVPPFSKELGLLVESILQRK